MKIPVWKIVWKFFFKVNHLYFRPCPNAHIEKTTAKYLATHSTLAQVGRRRGGDSKGWEEEREEEE